MFISKALEVTKHINNTLLLYFKFLNYILWRKTRKGLMVTFVGLTCFKICVEDNFHLK